ncbi:MAG: VanZ family protein [Pirellulales bacterium]|nr:VanZ family protein [Pirellulales bacterium]
MRTLFVAYLLALTVLLLSRAPRYVIGFDLGLLDNLDWLAHLISFLILALLALAADWRWPWWLVFLVLLVYSGSTELLQRFVLGRTPQWSDWFCDLAGIVLGAAIWELAARRRERIKTADHPTQPA